MIVHSVASPAVSDLLPGAGVWGSLIGKVIRAWLDIWNEQPRPYVWTKTVDDILASLAPYCKRIKDSAH